MLKGKKHKIVVLRTKQTLVGRFILMLLYDLIVKHLKRKVTQHRNCEYYFT